MAMGREARMRGPRSRRRRRLRRRIDERVNGDLVNGGLNMLQARHCIAVALGGVACSGKAEKLPLHIMCYEYPIGNIK